MCRGSYQVKPEKPFVPGLEFCGQVVDVGSGVSENWLTRRVVGSTVVGHGSFAQFALASHDHVFPAPEGLDDVSAVAFFVGYQTGWFGLIRQARLQPDEILLVHAAAGGVGSAAIQLGKAVGARVIAVAGGQRKAKITRELGADFVIDHRENDFVAAVKEITDGRGADVIYDPVGGETFQRSTKCVAFEGRIVGRRFCERRNSDDRDQSCAGEKLLSGGSSLGSLSRSLPGASSDGAPRALWSGNTRAHQPVGRGPAGLRRHT